jgi:hypothetical protein
MRERVRDGGEVVDLDAEVPVGSLGGASFCPRSDETDVANGGVRCDEGDDQLGEVQRRSRLDRLP